MRASIRNKFRPSIRLTLRRLQSALKAVGNEAWLNLRFGADLRRATEGKTALLLHVGCGSTILPGWVNIDAHPSTIGAVYFNAMNSLPMQIATVRRIHCEHFLEHLQFDQAVNFLRECHRGSGFRGFDADNCPRCWQVHVSVRDPR